MRVPSQKFVRVKEADEDGVGWGAVLYTTKSFIQVSLYALEVVHGHGGEQQAHAPAKRQSVAPGSGTASFRAFGQVGSRIRPMLGIGFRVG